MTPKDIADRAAHRHPTTAAYYHRHAYIDGATAERELLFEFIDWKEANGWQYVGKTTEQLFQLFLTTKSTTP